jgi:hypothetical protein
MQIYFRSILVLREHLNRLGCLLISLLNDAVSISVYPASNEWTTVNYELKRCGRERPWSNFKAMSRNLPGRTEENQEKSEVRIVGVPAEILTRYVQ